HPALDLKDDPERLTELAGRPEEREKRSSGPSESSTERTEPYKELVQRMSSEIDHLRELLTSERADRQKREDDVSTERQNYQQMLMLVQKDVQHLRRDNDRLKLLEHTKPEATEALRKEEVYSRPPAEEFKVEEIPPETIANRNSRGSLVGFGLSVAVIVGVLSYGAVTKGGEWLSDSLENGISAALKVNGTEPDR
ncbi:MAG: hypothetical protein VXY89_16240, partial [SAR324 cluster bacterium]|nr:hypothetical protein [SAR324 cluster bacterium]